MRRCIVISLAATTLVLIAACGGGDSSTNPSGTPNKTVDVFTVNEAFSPTVVQINAGDTVRFNIVPALNGDGHDVTFDATTGAPANIPVTLNGVIARVFKTSGAFHYNCFVHPGMSGDVDVQ